MSRNRSALSICFIALVAGLGLGASGCAGRLNNANFQVARQASMQMSCPENGLAVSPLGNAQWQVQGCGRSATFVCNGGGGGYRGGWGWRGGGYGGGGCQMISPMVAMQGGPVVNGPQYGAQVQYGGQGQYAVQGQVAVQPGYSPQAPVGYAPAPQAPTVSGQVWSDEVGLTMFAQLQAPVLACVPGGGPLVLQLEIQLDGRIARVGGIESLPPDQQTCLNLAVQTAAVPGGLSQAVRVPFTFR